MTNDLFEVTPLKTKKRARFLKNMVVRIKNLNSVWAWVAVATIVLSVFSLYGGQKNIMGVLTVGFDKNLEKTAQEEVIKLLADVSKLIVLPADEIPVIATVNDPVKLTNQKFFTNAKRGDKVLIYPHSRKAILYSPSNKKIIEVAPLINLDNQK